MSKGLIHPSAIRSGLVDLEMAEETVDLVHKNLADSQAHLQGEPLNVDSLPEDMRKMRLTNAPSEREIIEEDEEEYSSEDEYYLSQGQDPMVPFQNFLDELGTQIVRRMKSGDGFFKIWSAASEDIKGYVLSTFMKPETQATVSKPTQTDSLSVPRPSQGYTSVPRDKPSNSESQGGGVKPKKVQKSEWTRDTDEISDIEGEVAHQVAESFSKKYKFPSRSSGIFLWNFEQLKMNLDDIVKTSMNVPGVDKIAEKGGKLPLRCILGFVSLDSSKRFRLLADTDKVARLMQDDIHNYMTRIEEIDHN
uniref:Phosphoprotein n=3 Tax=Lagos bat virus TaxID=38766 RepID=PHOSP_LBV|nr:RecName: Full=Phosphoprotein; Short=Protein P; AltName: Full=Protein M1 [Lyssavirus lagos]AAC04584.1 phosphoprotein [Lyssavirus lagos]